MNRKPRILTSIAAVATTAVLAGCSVPVIQTTTSAAGSSSTTTTASASSTTSATATTLSAGASVTEARSSNANPDAAATTYDAASATTITMSGTSATVKGAGATAAGGTVTITEGGTYVLTGNLTGQVVVKSTSDEEVKIVLSNATITSSTGSALSFTDAGEAVVVLADGTTNALTDAATYADTSDEAANAALFSTADLTLGGTGTLNVKGQYNDGIASKDGLVITSGTISVAATDDGIRGKDHIAVSGGTITVDAGGDALKSDNTTDADAGFVDISGGRLALSAGTQSGDGIDAVNDIIISGGTINVKQSYEGLEALNIIVGGGTTEVTASDDGINVSETSDETTTTTQQGPGGPGGEQAIAGTASISGGTLTLHADGDGFDSNGSASITGGTVVVDQTGGGNGALDVNGDFTITGGTLIALGDASMPVSPDTSSAQGWIATNTTGSAGSTVEVKSGSAVIASFTATRAFGNLVYSSSKVTSGSSYTVSVNGKATNVTADQAVSGRMGGGGRR